MVKAYLIPQLKLNLLFCLRLCYYRKTIKVENEKCVIFDRKSDYEVLGTLRKRNSDGLFASKNTTVKSLQSYILLGLQYQDKNKAVTVLSRLIYLGIRE